MFNLQNIYGKARVPPDRIYGRYFLGEEGELGSIKSSALQILDEKRPNKLPPIIFITGPFMTGKTTLVEELIEGRNALTPPVDFQDLERRELGQQSISDMLKKYLSRNPNPGLIVTSTISDLPTTLEKAMQFLPPYIDLTKRLGIPLIVHGVYSSIKDDPSSYCFNQNYLREASYNTINSFLKGKQPFYIFPTEIDFEKFARHLVTVAETLRSSGRSIVEEIRLNFNPPNWRELVKESDNIDLFTLSPYAQRLQEAMERGDTQKIQHLLENPTPYRTWEDVEVDFAKLESEREGLPPQNSDN